MEYLAFIDEAVPNPQIYGGKGSNLIELHNFGIEIPPGFIITTKAYKELLDSQLKIKLSKVLEYDYQPHETINISNEIRRAFSEMQFSQNILNEIKIAFNKLQKDFGKNITFAVRSSANIEDQREFSFAGQAESYLCVKDFHEIIKSLKNCLASLYSPQALLYLRQMRKKQKLIGHYDIEMAIIIQKMINAEISGVLFTVNVINNNRNQILINSTWGLGETITGSKIIPDSLILNKMNGKIEKLIIGDKKLTMIPNSKETSTRLIDTEEFLRNKCSINQEQIQELYKLGLEIEKKFNYPQDIEWAIENNKLYTLQARPITTL